jgi:hypothetical protein
MPALKLVFNYPKNNISYLNLHKTIWQVNPCRGTPEFLYVHT